MTDEELEILALRVSRRATEVNTKALKDIGNMVKKIGDLRPTETHKLQQILQNSNLKVKEITDLISKFSGMSEKEIYDIYENVAKEDYDFAEQFYKYRMIDYVPFKRKEELQKTVKAIAKQSKTTFDNLSNTTVFALKDFKGNVRYVPLEKAYKEVISKAITLTQSGVTNYNTAIRNTLKQYADSGIRNVEYESGYSRRFDTAIRQNIIDGVKQVNQEIQLILGEEFRADGVEISVHDCCAEDHLPVQGRQFENGEYDKLQSNQSFKDYNGKKYTAIKRPITQWNCRHFAFSIVLGASQPNHTNEDLEKIKKENEKKISINGKEYTKYEATQEQRRLETEIRKAEDRYTIFESSGDNMMMHTTRKNITDLTRAYKQFSKEANLKPRLERTTVYRYKKANTSSDLR